MSTTNWENLHCGFLAARTGDELAARKVFAELSGILKGFFFARTRKEQDSEDLVQATLLKVHFARDSFDQTKSYKTWVFTIANRTLIDHWRGLSKRTHHTFDEESTPANPNDLQLPDIIELRENLEKIMDALKPMDRSIVYLYAVEGFSMKEISNVVGISEGAAKVRAHRSYKQLRELFIVLILLCQFHKRGV